MQSRKSISKIEIESKEKIFVGVDVHKKTFSVSFWSKDREMILKTFTQPSDYKVLLNSLSNYQDNIQKIIYEAGPTGFELARYLQEKNYNTEVVSPSHLPREQGKTAKSDKIDARKLAEYASMKKIKGVDIPTRDQEMRRDIYRLRTSLVHKLAGIKAEIKSFLLKHNLKEPAGLSHWSNNSILELKRMNIPSYMRFTLDHFIKELEFFEEEKKEATKQLEKICEEDRYNKKFDALTSVPGVGKITAIAFMLELFNPESFENARQVSKMLGLNPVVGESGETKKSRGREEGGKKYLTPMLIEAAWFWIRYDAAAKQKYMKLCRNTGNSKKSTAAMARKLGILLWRLSLTCGIYNPGQLNIPDNVSKEMEQSRKNLENKNKRKNNKKR